MNIQESYNQWSKFYDQVDNLTRDLDKIVTRKILNGYSCKSIFEIGCGTGKNTNYLAKIADIVYATDFSFGMISKASIQVKAKNVIFLVGDLNKNWVIKDNTVDTVVCNLVLEHIEDLDFIFHETSRVLGVGGKFIITELHPFKQYQGKQANFQQSGEKVKIKAFMHHITDFIGAASRNGLKLIQLSEWWYDDNKEKPPLLVSFTFEKEVKIP